jgi:hypothetical protein
MGYIPTTEELQFVYDMILNGFTDREILEEYAKLLTLGQLVFPLRPDRRFVKARRRELQAAQAVLEESVKRRVDPITIKARQDHFEYLTTISETLLSGGLHDLNEIYDPEDKNSSKPLYAVIRRVPDYEPVESWSLDELRGKLRENINLSYDKFGESQVSQYFLPHLQSENPELSSKSLFTIVQKNPFGLIETLKVLVQRKTFSGTCPICEDWQYL